MDDITRRRFLASAAATAGAVAIGGTAAANVAAPSLTVGAAAPSPATGPAALPVKFAVKIGMVGGKGSLTDKFRRVRDLGYDGIELNSPGATFDEVQAAKEATGLPVHGVVNSQHWSVRLSDPDPGVRKRAIETLAQAVRSSKAFGGSSVLLVPGRVAHPENENHDQVWSRSIAGIREVLPLAAELGIHILIENVWNGFCYQHDGPADQTAERLADYLDAINSPWVGAYFDIGNHRKYGVPQDWIRTLGRRIVKLDVKDWGKKNGWAKIGEGDVQWDEVRKALREIGFTGWCTAEVGGGDDKRLAEIKQNMDTTLRSAP